MDPTLSISVIPDLAGHWAGHYLQEGQSHPIAMEVIQDGERIRGTMRDRDTLAISDGSSDRELVEVLDEIFQSPGGDPIEVLSNLPALSTLEGHIDGKTVYFLKRYQGSHSFHIWQGDNELQVDLGEHRVHYRGTTDDCCAKIRGEWWIEDEGEEEDCGTFELNRIGMYN